MKDCITNYVQLYRNKMDITQETLAEAVGVSRQTIIALEKGNYAPSVLLALKIGKYFKTPIEKIFTLI